MNCGTTTRRLRAPQLLQALTACAAVLAGVPAIAQDTTQSAINGQVCAAQRFIDQGNNLGSDHLGCVANDLVVTTSSTLNSNTVQSCPINQQSPPPGLSLLVTVQSSSTDRYNVGYFVGENGNAANYLGGTCSIAIFPTTPDGINGSGHKWFNADNNGCGDYNKGSTTTNQVDNVIVFCQGDANGNLVIPYTLVYGNNGDPTCNSGTVSAGTQSKCQTGTTPVTNVFVTTDANPSCTKSFGTGAAGDVLTSTIVISNNDPLHNQDANGTTFEDNFNNNTPVLDVLTVNCVGAGGATCSASESSTNVVTGTINPFPFGSSVTLTITAATTPGDTSAYSNSVDLTTPPTVLPPSPPYTRDPATGISTFVGACSAQTTLPVKLQKFEVK